MSIRTLLTDIGDVRLGESGVAEVYLGNILVWPIVGCGTTLRLRFDGTTFVESSNPTKTIASTTDSALLEDVAGTNGVVGDFTAGGNLVVRYPFACDFGSRAFAIECNVKLANSSDVINLFDRTSPQGGDGSSFLYYRFRLYSTYVLFEYGMPGNWYRAVRLMLPFALMPNTWYRVIVQRDFSSQLSVFVDGTPGDGYRFLTGQTSGLGSWIDNFHDSLGPIPGQYFSDANLVFIGDATFRQSIGVTNNNHVANALSIGGAGYMDDYKVTVCATVMPSRVRIPNAPDPYYNDVALLMHFDEIEEQEFIDSGPYGHTPVIVGTPSIVQVNNNNTFASVTTHSLLGVGATTAAVGGGNSVWTTFKQISFPDAGDLFDLGGAGDFTIEFWAQVGAAWSAGAIMGYRVASPSGWGYYNTHNGWQISIGSYGCSDGCSGAFFSFSAAGPGDHFSGGTGGEPCVGNGCANQGLNILANGYNGVYPNFVSSPDEWHHYAVTRAGNTIRLFFNGKLVAYGPVPLNFSTAVVDYTLNPDYVPAIFTIGGTTPYNPAGAVAKVDEVRITRGVARYTSDFVLQSAPYYDTAATPTVPSAPTLVAIELV